jgi:hypothetical protein
VDYDKDEILQKCIKAIEDHKCTTFDEMSLYVAPTRQTLYNWGFDKFDIIKEAICQQKIIAKSRMKKNWQSEEAAPALQIAAFKLMADDDELEKLVINKSDVKANVNGEMKVLEINVNGFTEQSPIQDKDSV